MPLSWNEIRFKAIAFTKEWRDEVNENAEGKSFLDAFFEVFGVSRRRVASFESKVIKLDNRQGFIDLLWKGVILIELKSAGKNLDKAYKQATDYFPGLRDAELPKYILVSDFRRFRLYDMENGSNNEFGIEEFVDNIGLFGELAGYTKRVFKDQDPVNIQAAELMGKLHDQLQNIGYSGHPLKVYLVRLLFCLFADDTNIFERGIFFEYLDLKTREDGSDLAAHLSQIFEILNTPRESRFTNLDESLNMFPYINGKLFEEHLPSASFDRSMRDILIECSSLDWGRISPAIFGSLFQSVMDEKARRNLGAHYTSERNILKLIKPLFIDDLLKEFDKAKKESRTALEKFHYKLKNLRFLDPACGCGNFLIIAYRELRLLEIEIIKELLKDTLKKQQKITDIGIYFYLDVDQFFGIEFEEFPAQIAQVAMWLIDHQMNMQASQVFGEYYIRLPLKKSATIVHGNALRTNWHSLLSSFESAVNSFDYIFGNPPFIGKHLFTENQSDDMELIFHDTKAGGLLDYVAAWFLKSAQYMQQYSDDERVTNKTRVAFVSTNSITQGEQVGILWNTLFQRYKCKIHFAHKTFQWSNEARGNAAVHVVIIGFANFNIVNKTIFEYDGYHIEPFELSVKNINPYLIEGPDLAVTPRSRPISQVPAIINGSKPVDGGNLIISEEERKKLLLNHPQAEKYVRVFAGADDFIKGKKRWCLWLKDANPAELKKIPEILERIEKVRRFHLQSPKEYTRKRADYPSLFEQIRQPDSDFILIPRVSSENRKYIPLGFFSKDVIVSDTATFVPSASIFHFGILTSQMHMTWVKYICGRLESRYRYSNDIVYNNFPWPTEFSAKQKNAVEDASSKVLEIRNQFPENSLADLYDSTTMPEPLIGAHKILDRAVDLCYRSQPFYTEAFRIEYLFDLYSTSIDGLFANEKKTLPKKKK